VIGTKREVFTIWRRLKLKWKNQGGRVAQTVEHLSCKHNALISNPVSPKIKFKKGKSQFTLLEVKKVI
jgi:hypothetical protein